MFDVRVTLHPEVSVTVKVNVARSPDEAEQQAAGVDVLAAMFEDEAARPASPKPTIPTPNRAKSPADSWHEDAAATTEA